LIIISLNIKIIYFELFFICNVIDISDMSEQHIKPQLLQLSQLFSEYDKSITNENILDLEGELEDEEELQETLTNDSAAKIVEIKHFICENKATINDQHERLLFLNLNLRAVVKSNKEKQVADDAYNKLINSEEYHDITHKMTDIKRIIEDLRLFLISNNVRGRIK
jgi:hypothetical protein